MKNIKKILINENATIKQALKIISKGAIQIGIVVNDKKKLVGTLSDGDILTNLDFEKCLIITK